MIEAKVISFLGTKTGLNVYAERPKTLGSEFILVERTGAGMTNRIKRAVIAVQSYADSLCRAAEINALVESAMEDLVTVKDISKCELNSSYNYTDTETRKYRYQAVFNVYYMEGE